MQNWSKRFSPHIFSVYLFHLHRCSYCMLDGSLNQDIEVIKRRDISLFFRYIPSDQDCIFTYILDQYLSSHSSNLFTGDRLSLLGSRNILSLLLRTALTFGSLGKVYILNPFSKCVGRVCADACESILFLPSFTVQFFVCLS